MKRIDENVKYRRRATFGDRTRVLIQQSIDQADVMDEPTIVIRNIYISLHRVAEFTETLTAAIEQARNWQTEPWHEPATTPRADEVK